MILFIIKYVKVILFLIKYVFKIYTIKAEYFLWICPWIFLLITKHSIPFSIVLNGFRKWKAQPIPTYIFVFFKPIKSTFNSHFNCFKCFSKMKSPTNTSLHFRVFKSIKSFWIPFHTQRFTESNQIKKTIPSTWETRRKIF